MCDKFDVPIRRTAKAEKIIMTYENKYLVHLLLRIGDWSDAMVGIIWSGVNIYQESLLTVIPCSTNDSVEVVHNYRNSHRSGGFGTSPLGTTLLFGY